MPTVRARKRAASLNQVSVLGAPSTRALARETASLWTGAAMNHYRRLR